ncbi:MAG: cupredoxin domain-containing protein [Candidatus Polarisedimenticolia bacterium]
MALVKTILLVVALMVLGAGCARGGKEAGPSPTKEKEGSPTPTQALTSGEQAVFHGAKDVSGAPELELELDDNYFEPTVLEGKAGQKLTLKMFNEGEAVHNFMLQDQGIDKDVKAGGRDITVDVTFPQSGAVTFSCKYHVAQNMRGELKVK